MFNLTFIVAFLSLCLLIHKYIIYPTFTSPLSKIPNAHPTASISSLWINLMRYKLKEIQSIHAAHEKYGSIVRLGPNEISVNCYEGGIKTIYSGGFEKHPWYPNYFDNYGYPNMFSTAQRDLHSSRKRMLSNLYSKSVLQSSRTLAVAFEHILRDRLLSKLVGLTSPDGTGEVNIHKIFQTTFMDMVTAYQFGLCNSSNFVENDDEAEAWLHDYYIRKHYTFWSQEMPTITGIFEKIGISLSPPWLSEANKRLEQWGLRRCDAANKSVESATKQDEESHPENVAVVWRQLNSAIQAEEGKDADYWGRDRRMSIASEMLDNLSAGHETSSITLTYLFHELCQHPELQERLRAEVNELSKAPRGADTSSSDAEKRSFLSFRDIDSLPFLHVCIMETLRLHAAIPGPQPRITPDKPDLTLAGIHNIPANVRVSSMAYSLHRIPSVFPSPESFVPSRWLAADEDQKAEMHRHFWAFGSGGRMCIGSNLAMLMMKSLVALLIANFSFEIVDDRGIEQEDLYTAQPTSQRLILKLRRI